MVLAPNSFAWQWEEKIQEFTDTDVVYAQAKEKSTREYLRNVGDRVLYYIVPYSLFRRDYRDIARVDWDIVIADEAQEFRSFRSKTAKLMKKYMRAHYRWALTGTAISTKLEEVYCIMEWVDPKFLPPWYVFEKQHIIRSSIGVIWKYKNLKSLNEYLQARMDRKTHADQDGQMPELVEQIHRIPKSKEVKDTEAQLLSVLDNMVANFKIDSEGNVIGAPRDSKVAKAFHELKYRYSHDEAKLSYCTDLVERLLEENVDNRVVIFSFFKEPLYELGRRFNNSATFFTGDQDAEHKRAAVRRFRDGEARVLLTSNAGKAGLDLPFANYVVHIDVPFSFEVDDQRNKRITRANSTHRTSVAIYLVIEDSAENYYMKVVRSRGRLNSATLEGTEDEVTVREQSLRQFLVGGSPSKSNDKGASVSRTKGKTKPARQTARKAKSANKGRSAGRTGVRKPASRTKAKKKPKD